MTTQTLLKERGDRYGAYTANAQIMQEFKATMRRGQSWDSAPDIVKEALESIAIKLGRIVNGDPTYDDNWKDLAGYAQLVLDNLPKPTPAPHIPEKGAVFEPYTLMQDMLVGLGAKPRVIATVQPAGDVARADNIAEPTRPGTPEDGGHHAATGVHLGICKTYATQNGGTVFIDRQALDGTYIGLVGEGQKTKHVYYSNDGHVQNGEDAGYRIVGRVFKGPSEGYTSPSTVEAAVNVWYLTRNGQRVFIDRKLDNGTFVGLAPQGNREICIHYRADGTVEKGIDGDELVAVAPPQPPEVKRERLRREAI